MPCIYELINHPNMRGPWALGPKGPRAPWAGPQGPHGPHGPGSQGPMVPKGPWVQRAPPWDPWVPPMGSLGSPPWDPWVPPLGSLGTPPGIPGGEKNNLHFQPNFFLKKSPVAPLELIFCPSFFFFGVRIPNPASELPFKPPRAKNGRNKNNSQFQPNFFFFHQN